MIYSSDPLPIISVTSQGTYPRSTLHGRSHLLITSQRLHPKRDGLQLDSHLGEFLDVSTCTD
jgi:hypothetical protein